MPRPGGRFRFLRGLFSGERSLAQLLWVDMLGIGTAINFSTSALALLLYAVGAPVWLSLGFWGLPIPYNLALFTAVWLAASRDADAARAWTARVVALCWLPLMMLI